MTDEEIRIAIAEACGWSNVKVYPRSDSNKRNSEDTEPVCIGCRHPSWGAGPCSVPNYPECLNAMHEAEKCIPDEMRLKYRRNLNLAANGLSPGRLCKLSKEQQDQAFWQFATPTARQRAEAFLRTINMWKD